MHSVILRVLLLCICFGISASAQTRSRSNSAAKPSPAPAAAAEPDTTALGALALLPKDAATRVARIEGPDGHPFPDRWYILVHDETAPRGLREFVFAEGKLVTNRSLSQFADSIAPEDVIGAAAIKVNNDKAAGIAAQFAMHNQQQLGGIRYELAKSDAFPVPVWRLDCSDAKGQLLGTIILHATKGSLLNFQGFEKSPIVPEPAAAEDVARNSTSEKPTEKTAKRSPARTSTQVTASSKPPPRPAPRAMPVDRPPPPRQGPVDRVGSAFRRMFNN
jgi:hypothetical protein